MKGVKLGPYLFAMFSGLVLELCGFLVVMHYKCDVSTAYLTGIAVSIVVLAFILEMVKK